MGKAIQIIHITDIPKHCLSPIRRKNELKQKANLFLLTPCIN